MPRYDNLTVTINQAPNAIRWTVVSKEPLTENSLKELQLSRGYSPLGYGFYNLETVKNPLTDEFSYTWKSSNTCE